MNRRSFLAAGAAIPLVSCLGDAPWVTKQAGDEPYLERCSGSPKTLICHVHAWSSDYNEVSTWPQFKNLTNVCIVGPNAGGMNNSPTTGGAPEQMERIQRVIVQARNEHRCQRVIFSGYSGGMFASLMTLGTYPGIAYGAVLWNGPTDLAAWWNENTAHRSQLEACMGGSPSQVPDQYATRSPLNVAQNIYGVRIRINYGTQDTEVLPHHSQDAYNALQANNDAVLIPFSGGHVFNADVAMAQIQGMQL